MNSAQKPSYELPTLETVCASNLVGSPSSGRLQVEGRQYKPQMYGQSIKWLKRLFDDAEWKDFPVMLR